jgi:hypothetical protein
MVNELNGVKVGDCIRITKPWFFKGKYENSIKEEREVVKGAIAIVVDIKPNQSLPYIVKIIYINKDIYKLKPGFRGEIWAKSEFETISKEEAFLYVL